MGTLEGGIFVFHEKSMKNKIKKNKRGTEAVCLVFGSQNSNFLCQKGSPKQHTFVLSELEGSWLSLRELGKPCHLFTRDISWLQYCLKF